MTVSLFVGTASEFVDNDLGDLWLAGRRFKKVYRFRAQWGITFHVSASAINAYKLAAKWDAYAYDALDSDPGKEDENKYHTTGPLERFKKKKQSAADIDNMSEKRDCANGYCYQCYIFNNTTFVEKIKHAADWKFAESVAGLAENVPLVGKGLAKLGTKGIELMQGKGKYRIHFVGVVCSDGLRAAGVYNIPAHQPVTGGLTLSLGGALDT